MDAMEGIYDYLEKIAKPTQTHKFVNENHFYFETEDRENNYDGYNYGLFAVHQYPNGKRVVYPLFICYTDCYDIDDKFEVNQYEYIQDLNLFVNKGTKEYENGICGDDLNFDKAKQMIDVQVAQFYLLAKNQKVNNELNNIKRDFN